MAYAGALFADACLRGLNGDSNVIEPAYVQNDITELPFFATRVRLGPSGEQPQANRQLLHRGFLGGKENGLESMAHWYRQSQFAICSQVIWTL